jgi:hypothetical protein
MLRIEYVYWLCGALFLAASAFDLASRRYASAAFWAILSACFFGGDAIEAAAAAGNALPAQFGGIGVIALALIAGSGAPEAPRDERRRPSSPPRQRRAARQPVVPAGARDSVRYARAGSRAAVSQGSESRRVRYAPDDTGRARRRLRRSRRPRRWR